MSMNMYRRLAERVGTPDARELAAELVVWHDAMVKHVRATGERRGGECEDGCRHDDAARYWSAATAVFGDLAEELVFLRDHGRREQAPRRSQQEARP